MKEWDNRPIEGCRGCATTGGRMSCIAHGAVRYIQTSFAVLVPTKFVPVAP